MGAAVRGCVVLGSAEDRLMNVYLLETGCYEDRAVLGVFLTPGSAMAAWDRKGLGIQRGNHLSYTWSEESDGRWSFDADWDDAATITRYRIEGKCPS